MITRITGIVNRVLEEEVRLQVGAFEYQVLVPDSVRRQLQLKLNEEVTLHTNEYLEGTQMSNRMIPRLIGFMTETELDFFELFCTVEKIGIRKATRAMARPVHEIAQAIQRQDSKWLSTLPGIGGQTANQIIAALQKEVIRFTAAPTEVGEDGAVKPASVAGSLLEDTYNALLSVGLSPGDARNQLDKLTASGEQIRTVEEALHLIFSGKL